MSATGIPPNSPIAQAASCIQEAVCTENSIHVDHVSESPNLRGDDRSVLPLPGPIRLAVQVEEPT